MYNQRYKLTVRKHQFKGATVGFLVVILLSIDLVFRSFDSFFDCSSLQVVLFLRN